jgi:hypothetical protein
MDSVGGRTRGCDCVCTYGLYAELPRRFRDRKSWFDNSGRNDVLIGRVKLIPISMPKGTFRVWTKRVGNNPRMKLPPLHGGVAALMKRSKLSKAICRALEANITITIS